MYIIYIDGLTDNEMVERTITRPLLYEWRDTDLKAEVTTHIYQGNSDGEKTSDNVKNNTSVFERIFHHQTEAVDLVEKDTLMDAIACVLNGDTAIFIDGEDKALVLSTKSLPTRSIDSPQKEAGLKGPRDSFTENFRTNTALLRRRIKDPKMKEKQAYLGRRSRTVYGLMYMEDLVHPSLLR